LLLANEQARAILSKHLPGLLDAPQLSMAVGFTLEQVAGMAPGVFTTEVIQVSRGIYRLSPALHREARVEPSPVSPEEAILAYVKTHGRITRREAVALCGLTEKQVEYRLRRLVKANAIKVVGRGRNAHYVLAT
jgi:hypothetical protein